MKNCSPPTKKRVAMETTPRKNPPCKWMRGRMRKWMETDTQTVIPYISNPYYDIHTAFFSHTVTLTNTHTPKAKSLYCLITALVREALQ